MSSNNAVGDAAALQATQETQVILTAAQVIEMIDSNRQAAQMQNSVLEERINRIASLLERSAVNKPELYTTPTNSPKNNKALIASKRDLSLSDENIDNRFIPLASKWDSYNHSQLVEKIRKYYRVAIEEDDNEAESFLWATITMMSKKSSDWLRNRLALFREGNMMTAEERNKALYRDGRETKTYKGRPGYTNRGRFKSNFQKKREDAKGAGTKEDF